MCESAFNNPDFSGILEQALTNIIIAVAAEEKALLNILNLENDIIQKAKNDSVNLEEFVSINESVNTIISNIIKAKMITEINLQNMEKLIQIIEDFNENEILEE